jgi:flagellar hook-associated protein 1 FlgK
MGKDADNRISTDIDRVNELLKQINGLNADITRSQVAGADATGSENVQSGLIDELSTLMNIQVSQRSNGGVVVRSTEGLSLAGDGAAVVSYQKSSTANGLPAGHPGQRHRHPGRAEDLERRAQGSDGPAQHRAGALTDQLGEFVSRAAEELNRASNAASSVPAPAALSGRNTGLDEATALDHFTGKTTIAITDSSGVIQRRVEIDFDAGTMTVNGAAGPSFNNTDFIAQLNTAIGRPGHGRLRRRHPEPQRRRNRRRRHRR